jgi:excisionase family DNA binding protein
MKGKYLTLDQVAEQLNTSKYTVRQLISSGKLPAVRLNQRVTAETRSEVVDMLREALALVEAQT